MLAAIQQHDGISLTSSVELYGSPAPGLPLLVVDTEECYAVISLQGAQLLEFKRKPEFTPLLWLSPLAAFEPGKAIRGGIPLCAPWFGPHPTDKTKPKHGFVRNELWELTHADQTAISTDLTFTYARDQHDFSLVLHLSLGKDIRYTLEATNHSTQPMAFSWALHSYHPVGDLSTVRVEGLENIPFLDATKGFAQAVEASPIAFDGELDRVYESVPATQIIRGVPSIKIEGENCPTCIVWNPGASLAATMPDVREGFRDYICIERGAAHANAWQIAPHTTQKSSLNISLIP